MTWRAAIELQARQAQVRAALAALLAGVDDDLAARAPAPGAWSIAETVAHLVATERGIVAEMQLMLAQEHPELPSIRRLDEPAVLAAVIAEAGDLTGLLAAFDAAGAATLALVERLDEDEECRSGRSPELGNVLLGAYALDNACYHYPGHIEEIRAARARLGLTAGEHAPAGLHAGFFA